MKEIDWERIVNYGVLIGVVCASVPMLSRLPRTRGKNAVFHGLYIAVAIAMLILIPEDFQEDIFSPGGVIVIGSILPVYESIVAVCTPGEEDDSAWLQFWIASGSLSYATEFIDTIRESFPQGGEHWYEFEFFFTLWLLLPFTDGASLIYDVVTEPYICPTAKQLKQKFEGWISVILTIVNTSYLYLIWFTFMSLPEDARRFVVIAVGTLYPMVASTVALATKEGSKSGLDDTFWLTVSVIFLKLLPRLISYVSCAV